MLIKDEEIEKNLNPVTKSIMFITIILSAIVFLLKYLAYKLTFSFALYSEAMESVINIIGSIIALITIEISLRPPDHNHPFGHNKAEYFSAIIEAFLIISAALFIVKKIWLDKPWLNNHFIFNSGILFTLLSCFIQGGWGFFMLNRAKKYNSISLKADALHLLADFFTTISVIIGLVIAEISKYYYIDFIIAMLIALNISWHGYNILKKAIEGLMDHGVDKETYKQIQMIIANNGHGAIEAHDLKTRIAGYLIFIEFHLVVNSDMTIAKAHEICDNIEIALKNKLQNTRISIHVEPKEKAKIIQNPDKIPVI